MVAKLRAKLPSRPNIVEVRGKERKKKKEKKEKDSKEYYTKSKKSFDDQQPTRTRFTLLHPWSRTCLSILNENLSTISLTHGSDEGFVSSSRSTFSFHFTIYSEAAV